MEGQQEDDVASSGAPAPRRVARRRALRRRRQVDDPVFWGLLGATAGLTALGLLQPRVVLALPTALLVAAVLLRTLVRTARADLEVDRARSDVEAQERRYASLVEHASDAVALVGADGTIEYMSPPIEGMLGWTAEEMIGRPSHEFVHPDDLQRCIATWEQVLAVPGGTARVDIRHQTRSGEWRLIEGTFANLLHDPGVAGVVVNERDVTERRAAEVELAQKARREETVNLVGRHALEAVDLPVLAREATELVRRTLDAAGAGFVRVLPDGSGFVLDCWSGQVDAARGPQPLDGTSIEAEALRGDRPVTRSVGAGTSVTCVPVLGRHAPYGAVTVHREAGPPTSEDEQDFLRAITGVLGLAVQRREAEDEMRLQALHDPLTGLPNRALFLDRVRSALGRAQRHDLSVGVLFLDLDRFKDVNDGFGHTVGDEVLIAIGERLRSSVRPGDTVARLGGDEFTLLCEDLGDEQLDDLAERVVAAISEPISLAGTELRITASVGIRQAWGRERAEQLIGDADAAMYRAKQRGRARVEHFEPSLRVHLEERLQVGPDLQRAMANGDLRMAYQPVVDLEEGRTVAIEALLRWDDPERGEIPPSEFIGLAEEAGHMHDLGRWVLQTAIADVHRWGGEDPGLTVAVNVSPSQLAHPSFPGTVSDLLDATGLRADRLSLEVTEGAFEQDIDVVAEALQELRALGVTTAIDDFGTGYSSIAYLKRLPVDVLKLDGSFVANLDTSPEDRAIAAAVATFGRSLGLVTIAEGVETHEQADAVRAMGFDRAQGFLYGRPVPLDQVPLAGPSDPPGLLRVVG